MSEEQPNVFDRKGYWREQSRPAPTQRPAEERVNDFFEIYGTIDPEAARHEAARCVECAEPQCLQHCPLGNNIRGWLSLTAQGKFLEAAAVSQCTSSIPEIASRVCPQDKLCEKGCVLGKTGQPMAIGLIERFLNEYAFAHGGVDTRQRPVLHQQPVAVIGSGPSGLTCADELSKRGYPAVVYESASEPGGLLLLGIPGFKLNKDVVRRRIGVIEQRGIQFRCGIQVGKDVTLAQLFELGFQAIFLGTGAQAPKQMEIEGINLGGICQALPFLVQSQLAADTAFNSVRDKRVVVLGGGDTAMDCLRTAIRLKAKSAACVYRRDQANMPGSKKEYVNATAEGAQFNWLVNPVRIHGDKENHVVSVECQRMKLGEPDKSGRRSPVPTDEPTFHVPADIVVIAFGFDPAPLDTGMQTSLRLSRWGTFDINKDGMTNIPGIFAGGDAVSGADLVSTAARAGRDAAAGIDAFLTRLRDGK